MPYKLPDKKVMFRKAAANKMLKRFGMGLTYQTTRDRKDVSCI